MTTGSAVRCLIHVVSQIGAFHNLISDQAAAILGVMMTSFIELSRHQEDLNVQLQSSIKKQSGTASKNLDRVPQGHVC